MSGEPDDFLSRWSRRKLEVRQERSPVAAPAPVAVPEPEEAEAPSGQDVALTPEEIAALPNIDELTPETDITAFLRKGVPEVLKNAALRRMWSLDPAVRDYVGDARDYAYDWNVIGGVPGNGPLLPGDNVEAMMGQMFGDEPRLSDRLQTLAEEEPAREVAPVGGPEKSFERPATVPASRDGDAAPQHKELYSAAPGSDAGPLRQGRDTANAVLPGSAPDVAPPSGPHNGARAAASPRRHGRARPV